MGWFLSAFKNNKFKSGLFSINSAFKTKKKRLSVLILYRDSDHENICQVSPRFIKLELSYEHTKKNHKHTGYYFYYTDSTFVMHACKVIKNKEKWTKT